MLDVGLGSQRRRNSARQEQDGDATSAAEASYAHLHRIPGSDGALTGATMNRKGTRKFRVKSVARFAFLVAFVTFAAGCALNRSDVKSLRDLGASRIRLDSAIETSIAALNAIPAHCGPGRDHRVREEEFHVYQVIGRIARAKRERDHDIHIVLEDLDNPRARLVVESDDPDFRGNVKSPYRDRLAVARHMFDELVAQSGARELNDLRGIVVRVTGVGFFDLSHLQVGRSRSCIELHPILAIEQVRE